MCFKDLVCPKCNSKLWNYECQTMSEKVKCPECQTEMVKNYENGPDFGGFVGESSGSYGGTWIGNKPTYREKH